MTQFIHSLQKHIKPLNLVEYQIYRFRRERYQRWRGELSNSIYPKQSNLVSLILGDDFKKSANFETWLSRLLSETNQTLEIILDQVKNNSLGEDFTRHLSSKDQGTFTKRVSTIDDFNIYLKLSGEYIANIYSGFNLESIVLDNMVSMLRNNPSLDIIYDQGINIEGINDLSILSRISINWFLGDFPISNSFQEKIQYWIQAGLLFPSKKIDAQDLDVKCASQLFSEILINNSTEVQIMSDFCRDFYLSPWICIFETDSINNQSIRILNHLQKKITQAGGIFFTTEEDCGGDFSSLWIPTAYFYVTEDPSRAPSGITKVPENALKILFNISKNQNFDSIPQDWDLCVSIGSKFDTPLKLRKPWQGWIMVDDVNSLLNLLDIRVHAYDFRKIIKSINHPKLSTKKISVIIASYHRTDPLRQAIISLANQTMPRRDFEIVIVNNDPMDQTVDQVVSELNLEYFAGEDDILRLLRCPITGLSFARNVGLAEAVGEIVCFLDDDAYASETWLEEIYQAFREYPECGIIGGPIRLIHPEPRPRVLKAGLERFWTEYLPAYDRFTEVDHWMNYPWGANWSARREVLLQIGGFRGQYGRQRKGFSGGEEIIAASLIQKLGYSIAVQPSASVTHTPDPSRFTFRYLVNTIVSQILTNYYMSRDLYLEKEITLTNNFRGIGRFINSVRNILNSPRAEWSGRLLEHFCYLIAWCRLLFEQLVDTLRRLRLLD